MTLGPSNPVIFPFAATLAPYNPLPKITYHIYDFVTGDYIATLPFNGAKFADQLNTFAQFSGSVPIPLADPDVIALDPWDATEPGKRVIVVDIGGSPIQAYLIWTRNRKMSPQGISITAKSIYAWLTKRLQATDYSNPPESGITPITPMTYWASQPSDPTLIAAQLISDMLGNYFFDSSASGMNVLGGVGILINGKPPNAGSPVSSNTIAPTYPYSSLQSMDTIMQQLVALGWQVGFDIYFTVTYSNGPRSPLIATINIVYPRSGRSASASGLVVDMNRARNYSVDEDFGPTGSVQYEQGVPLTLWVDDNTFPREQGWPLTEVVQSRSTLSGPNAPALLKSIGQGDSYLYSYPAVTATVTLSLWGDDPRIGSFITGDDARWLYAPVTPGKARGNGDYNFPDGFDQEMRIVGWAVTVADEGDSTLDVTLNSPPALIAAAPVISDVNPGGPNIPA